MRLGALGAVMAETKHTPGPWEYDVVRTSIGRCFRIGSKGQLEASKCKDSGIRVPSYACLYDDYPGKDDNETRANARLIAAAPAMLAELESGEAGLVMLLRAIEEGDPAGELSVRVRDMIASHRAAIAQATREARMTKADELRAIYEWLRRPDWDEPFGTKQIINWLNDRPSGLKLTQSADALDQMAEALRLSLLILNRDMSPNLCAEIDTALRAAGYEVDHA